MKTHTQIKPSRLSSAIKWRTELLHQALLTVLSTYILKKTSTNAFYLLIRLQTIVFCTRETRCNFIQVSFCLPFHLLVDFLSFCFCLCSFSYFYIRNKLFFIFKIFILLYYLIFFFLVFKFFNFLPFFFLLYSIKLFSTRRPKHT